LRLVMLSVLVLALSRFIPATDSWRMVAKGIAKLAAILAAWVGLGRVPDKPATAHFGRSADRSFKSRRIPIITPGGMGLEPPFHQR